MKDLTPLISSKSITPRDSRGCEPARRGPVRRRGRAVIRIATSFALCATQHRAPTIAFMLGGEELSSCLVRRHWQGQVAAERVRELPHTVRQKVPLREFPNS